MTSRRIVPAVVVVAALAAVSASAAGRPDAGRAVDMAAWNAAAAGAPLDLQVGAAPLRVRLEEREILTPEARAGLAAAGAGTTIRTFSGTVDGDARALVRVTLTDTWAAGYVLTLGKGIEIVPARDGAIVRPETASATAGAIIDEEPVPRPTTRSHVGGCNSFTPHALASPAGLVSGWSTRVLSTAIAVDSTFVSRNGTAWAAAATAIMNGVDGIFSQINVNLSIVDVHSHTSGILSSSEPFDLLDQLVAHYSSAHSGLAREDVSLLVGKDLAGDVVGVANCIGGAGNKDVAFQLSQTVGLDPVTVFGQTFYSNWVVKTAAHELGHIFNAHHHYGNCAEAGVSPLPDACTLMFPTLDALDERMGSLERLVMRGWAESFI